MRRDAEPKTALYFSVAQSPSALLCVVARAAPGARLLDLKHAIYQAVRETDPPVPPMRLATIDDIVDETISNLRIYPVSTVAFASVALC